MLKNVLTTTSLVITFFGNCVFSLSKLLIVEQDSVLRWNNNLKKIFCFGGIISGYSNERKRMLLFRNRIFFIDLKIRKRKLL